MRHAPIIADPTARSRPPAPGHLCLLDAGRGLAALAVVLFHCNHFFHQFPANALDPRWASYEPGFAVLWPFYQYGLYAVNAFWMISGFVFARTYCGAGISTRAFAVNRFARLYPLHLLTLLVVAALQFTAMRLHGFWPIYGNNDLPRFVEHLTLTSAWGYDTRSAFNGPDWSISVEIVVYAAFWCAADWLHRSGPVAALLLAGLAGLALLAGLQSLIVACGYFFFLGAALHLAVRALPSSVTSGLGLALLALALPLLSGHQPLLWNALGLPALFGGLILLLVGFETRASARLRRAGQWIGDTTYGTYLWHVPLQIALVVALYGRVDITALTGRPAFLLAWLATVVLVARLSFVRFERPLRRRLRQALYTSRIPGSAHRVRTSLPPCEQVM